MYNLANLSSQSMAKPTHMPMRFFTRYYFFTTSEPRLAAV